jgi:hypothetical protein
MTEHDLPQERDLPAGRFTKLKEELMTQIEQDLELEERATPVVTPRRWRRIGLTAAALVAGLALATPFVLGGEDQATANTAVRADDGGIVITIHEGKKPKDLERRLNDLGMPVVVDFLESGYGCDRARATAYVQEQRDLFDPNPPDEDDGLDDDQFVVYPDVIEEGETALLEFQIDEHEGEIASQVVASIAIGPVGPCERVENDSIVDAEKGIAGG